MASAQKKRQHQQAKRYRNHLPPGILVMPEIVIGLLCLLYGLGWIVNAVFFDGGYGCWGWFHSWRYNCSRNYDIAMSWVWWLGVALCGCGLLAHGIRRYFRLKRQAAEARAFLQKMDT